jgi:hypothetical protein
VSRESKVLIGVGGLAVIGLLLALMGSMALGLLVLAAGLIAGFLALRVLKPDDDDPFADARSEADQSNTGSLTPNEPLTAWNPEGGLSAWTPPAGVAPPAPAFEPEPTFAPEPTAEFDATPATAWDDQGWDSTVTWEADAPTPPAPAPEAPSFPEPGYGRSAETNPLDDLVGLDALDPIAEVERIESRPPAESDGYTGFTPFDSVADVALDIHGNPVNEDVTDADDIMAASQATELNLADGEQTELQKLLAKVQIRLSAYE